MEENGIMTTIHDDIMNHIEYKDFINIINNIPSCIFFKDTELKYRFSSHCWEQLISDDIIGKTDLDIRKDTDNAKLAMDMDRNIIHTGVGCKYVIKSEVDDHISYLELNKEPVFDEDGKVIGIVGLINDITEKTTLSQSLEASNEELKTSLEKVERMNKAQKMFTASMNHELRSPLNGIIGLLQLLMEDETLNSTQHEYVCNAHQSSQMLLQIVNDLLDYAKMETSEFTIRKEAFEIRSAIKSISKTMEQFASKKGLTFTTSIGEGLNQELYGDKLRINQVIQNLVSNAIKYTEKGFVNLILDYKNGKLEMICSDTGQGISKEAMKYLFDPFVRFNDDKNHFIQGTGLGLSVVKKIVEKMDGEITVSSEINQGSTFTVVIPMQVSEMTQTKKQNAYDANTSFDFNHLRVLCVDDTTVNISVFAALLRDTGVELDKAFSGQEGIDLAHKNKYDVIFMDHHMPKMDGVEAFQKIRENSLLNKETPIVVLTANVGREYEKEYERIGFNGYLTKPVIREQLLAKIYEVLH